MLNLFKDQADCEEVVRTFILNLQAIAHKQCETMCLEKPTFLT